MNDLHATWLFNCDEYDSDEANEEYIVRPWSVYRMLWSPTAVLAYRFVFTIQINQTPLGANNRDMPVKRPRFQDSHSLLE